MKKLVTAVIAFTITVSLGATTEAGQKGFSGGSGMSMRSMGGSMSRSMGGNMSSRTMSGGTNMRSMGGMSSGMSSRSMSLPRGMSNGNFSNSARNVGGANSFPGGISRSVGGNVSRNVGSTIAGNAKSSPGGLGNIVRRLPNAGSDSRVTTSRPDLGQFGNKLDSRLGKTFDRSVVREVTKGNLGNFVGRGAVSDFGKSKLGNVLGSRDLGGRAGSIISGNLKSGRIRTGDLAKIDRSKLRDLVRGIGSGKGGAGGVLPVGGRKSLNGIFKDFDKGSLADAIHNGGLQQFNSANLLGGKSGFKSASAGLLASAAFAHHHGHHHHHHHHDHWFDFAFGDFWFGHHVDHYYDHCYYEPYYNDPCWYPVYTYPACGVTFAASPEIVTVAATQPIIVDQEITLAAATEEVEAAKPVVEEELLADSDQLDAIFGDKADNDTGNDAGAAEAKATEEAMADDSKPESNSSEAVGAAIAETPTIDVKPVEPAVQPDMDLELIDVQLVAAGSREAKAGPSFKVTVRNAGKRNLDKFLVSLVACRDAQIDSNSVHASTAVEELAAGAETSLTVTLPFEAMSLNRDAQGRTAPYKSLVAAVDSDERISEGNEENNLALIDRTSIQLANN